MRLENTWQEIRDHSFIQNLSRSFRFPAPWRCFFSSVHLTHVLQGSGQRTGMVIAEAWFCAQWPICVLFLRFVFGLLYGWKIQTWPIMRFLTESVTCWFFRHTSSSRQFRNIFCWLEILNYCPDGGNGNCHCSISFLKATSLICEAQLSFAAHHKYIICFFSLWWMIKLILALFPLLFTFLWNRKPWLDNFMFIITLECSIFNMNRNILQKYFTHKKLLGCQ